MKTKHTLTRQTFNAEQLLNIKRTAHNIIRRAPDFREQTIFEATIEAVLTELKNANKNVKES